jgi:hypothetical protein
MIIDKIWMRLDSGTELALYIEWRYDSTLETTRADLDEARHRLHDAIKGMEDDLPKPRKKRRPQRNERI